MSVDLATQQFSLDEIPQLDNPQKQAVHQMCLVTIFNSNAQVKDIWHSLSLATAKTGIRSFILVSRGKERGPEDEYRKSFVFAHDGARYQNQSQVPDEPVFIHETEFLKDIQEKWEELKAPAEVNRIIQVRFTINSAMSEREMKKAAADGFRQAYWGAIGEAKKELTEIDAGRKFDGTSDESLVHRSLCKLAGSPDSVLAFAFDAALDYFDVSAERAVRAANILRIPVGKDFDSSPLMALPDDAVSDVDTRWKAARSPG